MQTKHEIMTSQDNEKRFCGRGFIIPFWLFTKRDTSNTNNYTVRTDYQTLVCKSNRAVAMKLFLGGGGGCMKMKNVKTNMDYSREKVLADLNFLRENRAANFIGKKYGCTQFIDEIKISLMKILGDLGETCILPD